MRTAILGRLGGTVLLEKRVPPRPGLQELEGPPGVPPLGPRPAVEKQVVRESDGLMEQAVLAPHAYGSHLPTKQKNNEKKINISETIEASFMISNKLQQKDNKRFIAPDNRLTKLLDVSEKDKITYFNIQKYMNKHFVKGE